MKERRSSIRLRPRAELTVWDETTDQLLGTVINISDEGLMLHCQKPVGEGAKFKCTMECPCSTTGSRRVDFDAQSLWCRPDEQDRTYEVGFYVPNFRPEDVELIRTLTERPAVKS